MATFKKIILEKVLSTQYTDLSIFDVLLTINNHFRLVSKMNKKSKLPMVVWWEKQVPMEKSLPLLRRQKIELADKWFIPADSGVDNKKQLG